LLDNNIKKYKINLLNLYLKLIKGKKMIEFKNVSVSYSKAYFALYNVSVKFEKDCINVVYGIFGAGKTTLLRCIAGLENYTGEILFNGKDIKLLDYSKNFNVCYIPTVPVFFENKTILKNIIYALKVRCGKFEKDDIIRQLKNFGFDNENEKVKYLSFFQKVKLSLFRAKFRKVDVLLIGQVFDNLKEEEKQELDKIIKEFFSNSLIIVTTENKKEFFKDCNRVKLDCGILKN
jgi:ABC-type multidrug transport system ATPase subunit